MLSIKLRAASPLLILLSLFATPPLFGAQPEAPTTAPAATAAPAAGAELQEVTVSASAITIAGYDQPTPVTSLGLQQLQSAAQPDLSDAVRALPAFAGSSSPQNTWSSENISNGNAGLDQLNLRNLGPSRTLLLIDGQRTVNGSIYGGVDTGNIPTTLVERVDVVTGGASAIWGSDAVAGVVNYILNKDFNGLEVDVQYSNNSQNAHEEYQGTLTGGTGFDDNRGHIEFSLEHRRYPDTFYVREAQGFEFQRLVNNPACDLSAGMGTPNYVTGAICPPGVPAMIHANNVGVSSATNGGLINNCVTAVGYPTGNFNCSLNNIYFVGPNGSPQSFNPGNVTAGFFSNGGTLNTQIGNGNIMGLPESSDEAFLYGKFKFNDHVEATLQGNFGYTSFYGNSYVDIQYGNSNPAVIYSGNPYIPASIASTMGAQGIPGLAIGTLNTNPAYGPYQNPQSQENSVGMLVLFQSRRLIRGVFGLDGDINGNWTWNAYWERSETHMLETGLNNQLTSSLVAAEDAVTVGNYGSLIGCPAGVSFCTAGSGVPYSAANFPNPLGLVKGAITCASNLLPRNAPGATSNCAPLNIFGYGPGVASPEAIQYVNQVARAGQNFAYTNLTRDVGAVNVQGKLPFGTTAGPVAMAAGLDWRDEGGIQANCGVNCTDYNFPFGNFQNFLGYYNVKEASLEFNAPLLKNQGVKDLNVDAAYRAIDYSTSGFVQTYKFGLVSQLTDLARLRVSYSRDIRAGDMYELFEPGQGAGTAVVDPRTGLSEPVFGVSEGNRSIQPEQAETRTAGFVLTPMQGLIASIDWYYIRINKVINEGLPDPEIVNLCLQGQTSFCNDFLYGRYPTNVCVGIKCPLNLPLAAVISQAVNSDWESESGIDFLADYRLPFMAGALDFNTNMNYVFALRYSSEGSTCDVMNGLGFDQYDYAGCIPTGMPKFKGTLGITYTQGGWLGTVQTRMLGAAHLVSQWASGPIQVDNNNIPFYTYIDLRLSYNWGNGVTLFGAVDNLFDRIQPFTAFTAQSGNTLYEAPTRDDVYDGFGRVYRVGLRAKF